MAVVQHKNIPDADLHEAKGAEGATIGQGLISNGDGTATFQNITPRGMSYFANIGTPYTLAFPAADTILSPVTTSTGNEVDTTVSTDCKLTYTGTRTLTHRISANISAGVSASSPATVTFSIYKNGTVIPNSYVVCNLLDTKTTNVSIMCETNLATNYELDIRVANSEASGDIIVYTCNFLSMGLQ